MPETDIDALTRASVPDDWTDLDRRAVDTVRVLAADAVQKVGNGHPGTAMSLAPLAYTLFQRVMRHDPDRPRLDRPRPVRALGRALQPHALHPALPLRLRPGARRPRGAAHLGQQDPRPPRAPAHPRCGDHHRPAGPGTGLGGRHGDGRPPRARPVRPGRRARREPVRPPDLRDRQRRRHRGGRHLRGVVAGRHAAAGQPHGGLRRQQDLDRGRHHDRAERGHRQALRGLRLARAGRRGRRERHRHPRGPARTRGRRPTGRRSSCSAP